MPVIEVQAESLAALAAKLRRAAGAAQLVATFGGGALVGRGVVGDEPLDGELRGFLRDWQHGAGFLAEDAGTLAGLLSQAATVYVDVETCIAGGVP